MDVVVSIVTDILKKLVDEAILQARYAFRFNHYVKQLETEKGNLQLKIEEVLERGKDAKKKTHKVVSKVDNWLNEANFLMAEVVELQEKTKRNKTSCLKHFPNLINRYNLAKQLEEKTSEIKKHYQAQFSEFSRIASLVGMNYFSSQDFVHFESRKVVYDGLLRAVKDDEIHMIGLHGMGGYGKTTLVKEVGKEAENFFDKVLFIVVSNTFDVRKIQSKIASQLKLPLGEEENLERAQRLFMRLTSGERFLIILDDVRGNLQFEEIGIPTTNNQMSCTTLITTRKLSVCESMKCQKIIPLKGLNEDESWALFQNRAGLFDEPSNNWKDIAQRITKECDGLPVAIVAVASALKDKPLDEWVEALKTLGDPSWIDIEEEGLKGIYGCLRLSYDTLENEVAKSLFLLCSVYPKDYEIRIDQLTIIGLGPGLAREIPSYQWARTQVINKAIKKLIDSCLLLKVREDGSLVKMHDLVRNVALWIAKKENKLVVGQLKEDLITNGHAIRYLWFEEGDKCPNKLTCPELEFLFASIYSDPCATIRNDFLNGMEKLRVLILQNPTDQEDLALQLPISIHLKNNLCCLMLYRWVLGDISFIGSLERLESLTIWDCSFDELPKCIIQQKKLRLIDLRHCKIQINPFEVMGRCSQLEVLYFCGNSGGDWEDQSNNSAEFFDKISTNTPALESYCIHFGNLDAHFLLHQDSLFCNSLVAKSLYIEDFENCISIATSKDMMRRAKNLSLMGIPRSWKNIIPDLWQTIGGGMNELTQLALHDSDGIECVIGRADNPSQVGFISNLTHLTLSRVKHLKTLYNGQPPQGLFANLEKLCINACHSLENILTEDVKEIVDVSEHQSYRNAFPKLEILQIINCKQIRYLMPVSFAKSLIRLKVLWLHENDELRSVFGQSLYEDLNLNKPHIFEFSSLIHLYLIDLQSIISICPESYYPTWPSLKWLQLNYCPQLNIKSVNHWLSFGGLIQDDNKMTSEDLLKVVVRPLEALQVLHIFNADVEVVFDVEHLPINCQQLNSSFREIICDNLSLLRYIWRGPKNSILLQHLYQLELVSCKNLKQVFPSSVLKRLPHLWAIYIVGCNELEEIIEEDDRNVSNSHQLVFPRLEIIYIKQCHKLKCVFPNISACRVIPSLKVLSIEDASLLEKAFGHEQHEITLEYVLLWHLPSLNSFAPSIALQTVRCIVVQGCAKLSLTSSVTPQEMLKQLSKGYLGECSKLKSQLEDIVKSIDDSGRETGGQSNDQKLTFIASPNSVENKNDSEDRNAHEQDMSKEKIIEGRVEECKTSEIVPIVTSSSHLEPASSTKHVNQTMHVLDVSPIPTSSLSPTSISWQLTSDPVDISEHKTLETIVRNQEGQSAQKDNISRENDVKRDFEGSPSSENVKIITPTTHSKLASSTPDILATSLINTNPNIQSQVKFNSRKSDIEKDEKLIPPINIQDFKDDYLLSVLESMEDEYGGKSSISSVFTAKDELVAKALADLEDSLKKPLKEIATSDSNTLCLLTALNFLSRLSLDDGALSHEVMAIIKSMHRDLPNILSSFNQAFATFNRFAVLEERDKRMKDELSQLKEAADSLVSELSVKQKFMDEAQEKEARLKEQISLLEKERKECEAALLFLQEQKRKCMAGAIELKKEFETVTKQKSEMEEDQRKARQQVLQIDHEWSVLGSQFELAIAKQNLS